MIEIVDNKFCCGCNACTQCCPKQCITMQEDMEGFLYPYVDKGSCIDCSLCEKVCPVINKREKQRPLYVYAAKNKNEEIRLKSSSGGIFTLLAEEFIHRNGIVFGACFDEKWEVKHDYADTRKGLSAFRGSKYMQSRIQGTYKEVEEFLKQGRKVMFTGSPCQIAGLRNYLRKDYENLCAVDFICHGVPSPKVWRKYLTGICEKVLKKELEDGGRSAFLWKRGYRIEDINFRDKKIGWKKFSFSLRLKFLLEDTSIDFSEPFSENIFMKAFLTDLILRPSCYQCPSKGGRSASDISIADYWSIQQVLPDFDDDKGISLVLINTSKGYTLYQSLDVESRETKYEEAQDRNGGFKEFVPVHPKRSSFFKQLEYVDMMTLISSTLKEPISRQIRQNLKKILRNWINK